MSVSFDDENYEKLLDVIKRHDWQIPVIKFLKNGKIFLLIQGKANCLEKSSYCPDKKRTLFVNKYLIEYFQDTGITGILNCFEESVDKWAYSPYTSPRIISINLHISQDSIINDLFTLLLKNNEWLSPLFIGDMFDSYYQEDYRRRSP